MIKVAALPLSAKGQKATYVEFGYNNKTGAAKLTIFVPPPSPYCFVSPLLTRPNMNKACKLGRENYLGGHKVNCRRRSRNRRARQT